jgi:hypothetical protein
MALELINEKDCVGRKGHKTNNEVKKESKSMPLKRINYADRKRCFKCGHRSATWCEILNRGRREYHYLCQNCLNIMEGK